MYSSSNELTYQSRSFHDSPNAALFEQCRCSVAALAARSLFSSIHLLRARPSKPLLFSSCLPITLPLPLALSVPSSERLTRLSRSSSFRYLDFQTKDNVALLRSKKQKVSRNPFCQNRSQNSLRVLRRDRTGLLPGLPPQLAHWCPAMLHLPARVTLSNTLGWKAGR